MRKKGLCEDNYWFVCHFYLLTFNLNNVKKYLTVQPNESYQTACPARVGTNMNSQNNSKK